MIHIAISSDDNYKKQCYTLILSALQNSSEKIHFHLINNGINNNDLEQMKKVCLQYHSLFSIYSFDEITDGLVTDGTYNMSSYARLFLTRCLDREIEKIIYCDCDAVFLDDPVKLYEVDISGYCAAGVLDFVRKNYRISLGLNCKDNYINAGLILFNLKELHKINFVDLVISCISYYNGAVPHHDQGVINKVLKGNLKIIDPRFNVLCPFFDLSIQRAKRLYDGVFYSQEEIDAAIKKPLFIHFTNGFFNRPWNIPCSHPYRDVYLEYYKTNPYDTTLVKKDLMIKVRIMKFIYKKFPFFVYLLVQKILNFVKNIK